MKAVGSLAIILATVAACGMFVYQHYPAATKAVVNSAEYRMVESTYPRKVVESITIDGKKVDVGIVAYDRVQRPVRLTASHEIVTQANSMDMLRYWVIVAVIVGLGVYGVFVFCLWARDKLARRETKDTEDTRQRLSEIGRLCTAVALTLFGSVGLDNHPAEPTHANAFQESTVGIPPPPAEIPSEPATLPPPAIHPALK